MRPVVITACTNRKRSQPPADLCARSLPAGDAGAVCAVWLSRLRAAEGPAAALSDLYCGRGFRDAEAAARSLEARLFVVSAGLGLAAAATAAPSYSLTLTRGSADCVFNAADGSAAAWWRALNAGSPFAAKGADDGGLILAALSRPYLDMVAQDWAAWPAERLARLRLFGMEPPADLPEALRAQWMPYDARLEAIPGRWGTRGDFAQRALRHFADDLAGASRSAADDAAAVRQSLSPHEAAPWPVRARASDDDLVALMIREWDAVGGRSGAMLRRLRRDLEVACEQGRFKDLFRRAAVAREGAQL